MDAAVEFVDSPQGTLLILGGKKPTCYRVIEVPVGRGFGDGRGFTLLKQWGGSDAEATGYDVFVSGGGTNGRFDSCNCKAWLVRGRCKHHDAMKGRVTRENG